MEPDGEYLFINKSDFNFSSQKSIKKTIMKKTSTKSQTNADFIKNHRFGDAFLYKMRPKRENGDFVKIMLPLW